jgi:hypothetical protein
VTGRIDQIDADLVGYDRAHGSIERSGAAFLYREAVIARTPHG